MTEYEYSGDGRLLRAVTMSESTWTDADADLAMAYELEMADQHACGHPLSETTAMKNGEPVHSYSVPPPVRCHACDALAKGQEQHEKTGTVRPAALLWAVEKKS